MKVSIISALLLASTATAFYINHPSSVWTTGSPAIISWQVTSQVEPKNCDSLSLELMNGPAENAIKVQDLAKGIDKMALSKSITVPNVPSASDYFLRLTCEGKNRVQFYSSRFTINNGSGNGGNTNVVNPPPATQNPSEPAAPAVDGNSASSVALNLTLIVHMIMFCAAAYLYL